MSEKITISVDGVDLSPAIVWDEVHEWPDGAEYLATARNISASFEMKVDPGFFRAFAVNLPDVRDFKTLEDEEPEEVEPSNVAPDGSFCDHPEDQLGPLPYQGRPPRDDEWECGACGYWQVHKPTRAEVRDDLVDRITKAYGVPPEMIGYAAGAAATTISAADAQRAFEEAKRRIGQAVFKPLPQLDIEVEFDVEIQEIANDPLSNRIPLRRGGRVVGPLTPGMTDTEVISVISNMEAEGRRAFRSRREPYWMVGHEGYARLQQLNTTMPMTYHAAVARTKLVGLEVRVDGRVQRDKLTLVFE